MENAFERATEFVPERWTTKPGMIKDKRAYNPFNNGMSHLTTPYAGIRPGFFVLTQEITIGRHSCPGKSLGLMEVRLCLSMILSRFHVGYAAGESGKQVWGDMTDSFTANPGPLLLTFTAREETAA